MGVSTEVIRGFRAGDPDAVREIVHEYGGAVLTVARSLVRDPELAADIVQQTFVKAWRSSAGFEGDRDIAPWLYAIARNTAIDVIRSESKPTRGGHDPEIELAVESTSLDEVWERYELRRALDRLPSDEREVVRRSHLLGQTHDEIARDLSIPIGTVKSRSSRAHRRLATALAHLAPNRPATHDVLDDEERP